MVDAQTIKDMVELFLIYLIASVISAVWIFGFMCVFAYCFEPDLRIGSMTIYLLIALICGSSVTLWDFFHPK